MKFIGITGGVGAGKSKVLNYIREHYLCEIYLADDVAHEVKLPGTACYRQLVSLLGEDVLCENGEIHKGRMAEKIFASETLLEQVNALIHPAVKEYLSERLTQAKMRESQGLPGSTQLFFVEAALLIECGYRALVDEMWYVYASEETRRVRLTQTRGYTAEKITQIMQAQLSEEAFRAGCDFVIDNSGRLEDTYAQIDRRLEAFTWRE